MNAFLIIWEDAQGQNQVSEFLYSLNELDVFGYSLLGIASKMTVQMFKESKLEKQVTYLPNEKNDSWKKEQQYV